MSEADFLGMIEPELLVEDHKLGPKEFESVMRRQLQAFSQARLANIPAVRTASDTDFLLFNTLKMTLLHLVPVSADNQSELQQNLRGSLAVLPDVKAMNTMTSLETLAPFPECNSSKKDCGAADGLGEEEKGTVRSRRSLRRLLESEEDGIGKLVHAIARPLRDLLLRDVVGPLGKEVARLQAVRGPIAGDVNGRLGAEVSTAGVISQRHVVCNDLVLLKGSEQPTAHLKAVEKQGEQGDEVVGSVARRRRAWLYPRIERERGSSLAPLIRSSINRRDSICKPQDQISQLLDLVEEAVQANNIASTIPYGAERPDTGSGAACSLPPPCVSDFQRRVEGGLLQQPMPSADKRKKEDSHPCHHPLLPSPATGQRQIDISSSSHLSRPQQPSLSLGQRLKDASSTPHAQRQIRRSERSELKGGPSSFPIFLQPLLQGTESGIASGSCTRSSLAHAPGSNLLPRSENGRESGDGSNKSGNLAQSEEGDMGEQVHGVGPGLMMHMRFSISS